jgi:hypothetical protein
MEFVPEGCEDCEETNQGMGVQIKLVLDWA